MKLKSLAVAVALVSANVYADLTTGEDVLYAVKAISGSTQDFGTIDPADGSFTRITQISPTGLGWPLGDVGSEPDPINGYVYTRQTNSESSQTDVLAIKKSDGSTKWLDVGGSTLVVGYDTKSNRLILNRQVELDGGERVNRLISYSMADASTEIISSSFSAGNINWQAGGIGAVNSFGRLAFQLRPDTSSTLYKIDLDTGEEDTVTISEYVTTIAWDSKNQKLYGLYDSNSNGAYRIAEIDVATGELTNVGAADTVNGMGNYVQLIAPNDQRYYVQQSSGQIVAVSLEDGAVLGTFAAPLRVLPPGAVVLGADEGDETVEFDITDPDAAVIKFGENTVTYTGTNESSGDVSVEAGTLKVAGSDQLGTGTVVLSGGELELSADGTVTNVIQSEDDTSSIDVGENDVVASGEVNGSSKLTKIGSGELELTGDLTNTGGIEVDEGTLVVNGEGTTSVTVDSGTLGGAGTIGDLIVSGSVAPGNSIGTLNVSGDVTLASGSTFIVEIDADGNTDKLIATGDVTIDGELQISAASGTYDNQTYVFLTGGSLTGEFSEVSITGCSATPSVTIGDTQASFVIVSCSSSNSSNDDAVISYINDLQSGASGDLATVLTAINALSGTDYSAAVAQLDHDGAAASIASVGQVASAAGASVSSRVSTVSASSPDASTFALMMADDGQQAIDIDSKKALLSQRGWWINLFGGSLDADERSSLGINGYKNDYAGTTLGYDVPNSEGGLNGFAITYSSGQVDADGSTGSTDYSSVILSPYYSARTANGGITTVYGHIGSSSNDGRRNISIGAIDRVAMSSYDSLTYGVGIEHQEGVRKIDGRFHTTRYGASLSAINVDGFTETGADSLNLEVDEMSQTIASVGFGHRIHWEDNNGDYKQMPFVDFGMDYLSFLEDQEASQALSGQSKFTTTAGEDSELNGSFGTGVVMRSDVDQFSFGVRYKIAEYYQDVSGSLEYKRFF